MARLRNPRTTADLRRRGLKANAKRVCRLLMREDKRNFFIITDSSLRTSSQRSWNSQVGRHNSNLLEEEFVHVAVIFDRFSMVARLLPAVFKLALAECYIERDPTAALHIARKAESDRRGGGKIPGGVRSSGKLIARLAIFEGMRPGEILALRWKSVAGAKLQVGERVYKRVLNTPKNGKAREGAMSDGTLNLLAEWFPLALDPSEEGFVFPSEKVVTPISLDNLWRRSMVPKLEPLGLSWASFQVLRKTNASLSKKAGVDPKVASDQRGHGIGVSLEVYTTSDLEQKRAAIKKLEAAVFRKLQPEVEADASRP